MENLDEFYSAFKKSHDILDFLDNVTEIKAFQQSNIADDSDIVELYLDFFNEDQKTMSRLAFDKKSCEILEISTLATMSGMSSDYKWSFEDFEYIYNERFGIAEEDGSASEDLVEGQALQDIKSSYLRQNVDQTENAPQLDQFTQDFKKYIKRTIQ